MDKFEESISRLTTKDEQSVSIIQITDTHILDDDGASFNQFDTAESLSNVINRIKKKETQADLMLLTGDLVHDPTKTAYQKLADTLFDLPLPLFCLPGNHDDPELMAYVMGANGVKADRLIEIGQWAIVLLNTNQGEGESGTLADTELAFLDDSLGYFKDQHCLIALHHHPVSIKSSWMDAMMLTNSDAFFEIVDRHTGVKGIIWGHAHQEFDDVRHEVQLYGTPSTCLQFKPGSDRFSVDDKPPAYRRLTLKSTGKIKTKVVYV